jgi:DNA-binding MarR family transcriptional regulator
MTTRARRARLPIDDSIFFRLVRVVNLTARPFSESIGKSHRLALNEWRVLLVLANHPGVAASEVAALTGLDKMSVSRALAGLVRRGRVLRRVDAADKRRTLLRLSAAGERLYERIGAPAKERERLLFRGIGVAEQKQLGHTLDRLIENLVEAESGTA